MPEFKVCCEYYQIQVRKFFKGEKEKDYHRFLVKNPQIIPEKYCSKWKGKFKENHVKSWIWIADELLKKIGFNNFVKEEDRKLKIMFILKLGEEKGAKFWTKNSHDNNDNTPWHNNMVLKTPEYFQNTVQKIGYWGSENYFYEVNKKEDSPSQPNQPNSNQSDNKNIWLKVTFVCLIFLVPALLLLCLIKWISKRKK